MPPASTPISDNYNIVGTGHGEAFSDVRPATSMYEIEALVDPEMLFEIEGTAVLRK